MKHKFPILILSLLLAVLLSGEILSMQPLKYITLEEVNEKFDVDVSVRIFENIIVEDGGCFGDSKAFHQENIRITHIDIPVKLSIGDFPNTFRLNQTPRYIKYCCLKIAC